MFRGFYNLTSGMLSQSRRLDVVASNMTNINTPGYKTDAYTDSTFHEVLLTRTGNKDKYGAVDLGRLSYILAPSQLYTDFEQGTMDETGLALDFAIEGEGFFAVDTGDATMYTRAGNFSLDEEGYLCLPGKGRILDVSGNPIYLQTDQITVNSLGELYTEWGGFLGQLGIFTFPEGQEPVRNPEGLFNLVAGATPEPSTATVRWKSLERSNVDLLKQMTQMMTSQRALQSAAQVSKIYDGIMNKAANELGRL